MKAIIERVSETNFRQYTFPILFEDELTNRAFGIISYGKYNYKLAWQSDYINPIFELLGEDLGAVGVDQRFVIFTLSSGLVQQKYLLAYFLSDVKLFDNTIYVLTQLEIITIDKKTLTIKNEFNLPSYFENIYFDSNSIIVECIDGQTVNLTTSPGNP